MTRGGPPGARAARRRSDPSLGVLSVLLLVLFVVPSRLIFAPLGGAGSPTQMIGMALFVLWVLRRASGDVRTRPTPMHWAMLALAASILVSYACAALRPITVIETSAADRGVLAVIGWLGLFLATADTICSTGDLDRFLHRLVVGGGFVAVVGLLQFVLKQQLTDYIHVPGLSDTTGLALGDRNGFTRPDGTTIHPIEFGAVLTMVLPLALQFALLERDRSWLARWWPVTAMAVAVPLSISRSAIISGAVILIALLPTWAREVRRRAYAALVVLGAVIYFLVPGLLGTIVGLFSGISGDDSTLSRTNSYALAGQFIDRSPVFGRGFLTFLTSYRILDNEYLGLMIQIGLVGFGVVLGLFTTAMVSSWRLRQSTQDPWTRAVAQALLASIASMAFSMAVFDAFSFPMATNVLFLLLGAVGALLRTAGTDAAHGRQPAGLTGRTALPVR